MRTSWDRYFERKVSDPAMRVLVEQELEGLRVGARPARIRQEQGLT